MLPWTLVPPPEVERAEGTKGEKEVAEEAVANSFVRSARLTSMRTARSTFAPVLALHST